MSKTTIVFARIAVFVPEHALARPGDCEPALCTECGGCCPSWPGNQSVFVPLVTAEMVAIYREHPDNN